MLDLHFPKQTEALHVSEQGIYIWCFVGLRTGPERAALRGMAGTVRFSHLSPTRCHGVPASFSSQCPVFGKQQIPLAQLRGAEPSPQTPILLRVAARVRMFCNFIENVISN